MSKENNVTIDQFGHILIPKTVRVHTGVTPGTMFIAEECDDQGLLLRPLLVEPPLIDKEGILVVQSQATGELLGVEKRERDARVAELLKRTEL